MKLKPLTITILTFFVAAFSGMKAASATSFSVIADGLYNAGGLSFGPDGSLYVTEAGIGEVGLVFHQQVVKAIHYAMAQLGQLPKLRMVKPNAYLQDFLP